MSKWYVILLVRREGASSAEAATSTATRVAAASHMVGHATTPTATTAASSTAGTTSVGIADAWLVGALWHDFDGSSF